MQLSSSNQEMNGLDWSQNLKHTFKSSQQQIKCQVMIT
jgi:hypothetical protein